jgi:hypothetical protein
VTSSPHLILLYNTGSMGSRVVRVRCVALLIGLALASCSSEGSGGLVCGGFVHGYQVNIEVPCCDARNGDLVARFPGVQPQHQDVDVSGVANGGTITVFVPYPDSFMPGQAQVAFEVTIGVSVLLGSVLFTPNLDRCLELDVVAQPTVADAGPR